MEDWRVEQLEAALEKDGAKSRKAAKLRKQIAKLRTDKAEADGVPSLRLFVPDVDWLTQAAADRGFEAHRSTVWAVTP